MDDLFSTLRLPGFSPLPEATAPVSAALPRVMPAWQNEPDYLPSGDPAYGDEAGGYGYRGNGWPGGHGSEPGLAGGAGLDPTEITAGLNEQQYQAVTHSGGPLLVMAGAGSGKTRVLTRRIAHLIATGEARPGQILAITFTNKAAAEMRERVADLIGPPAARMWVSTFHSACVRILRREHQAAGLSSTFTIYDAADSKRLLTMVCKSLDIDPKAFPVKRFANAISNLKNELIDPEDYSRNAPYGPFEQNLVQVYRAYQQRLRTNNAVDFDDLIMHTVHLLQAMPQVAATYQRWFRHILVDEYQDTNPAQYQLIRELVGIGAHGAPELIGLPPAQLTVVGDSDQSIYAFRGATIRNIEEFEKDFPGARTIYLEQNYRSTGNILAAANAVIAANAGTSRHKKNLWTAEGEGPRVVLYAADSEHDEARWVVAEIDEMVEKGRRYSDFAVFYRTNAQSRPIEEIMIRSGLPYRVVGGTKFYERKEIKDAVAYLAAAANLDDDVNLRRVLNVPKRGLGDKAEEALAAHAARYGVSFGRAIAHALGIDPDKGGAVESAGAAGAADVGAAGSAGAAAESTEGALSPGLAGGGAAAQVPEVLGLSSRAISSLRKFWQLLQAARSLDEQGAPMGEILDRVLEESGYLAALQATGDPQDQGRVENLAELHAVAEEFSAAEPAARLPEFLERISLVADSDQIPDGAEGEVTLMTVHTAKGLEFPVIFVTGMEDGTFPHQRSLTDPQQLAEERRLAYVAITRAREQLFLTRAGTRSQWGADMDFAASRFLDEIPTDLLDVRRANTTRENYSGFGDPELRGQGRSSFGYGSARGGAYAGGAGAGRSGGGSAAGRSSGGGTVGGSSVGSGRLGGFGSLTTAAGLGSTGPTKKKKIQAHEPLDLALGDKVKHDLYGEGTVVGVEGSGENASAKIKFKNGSTKRLLLRFAPLTKL